MIGIVYFRNVKNDLELLLLDDTIQSMPCLLPKQPLYYLITEDSPEHISIIENQLFSKSMAMHWSTSYKKPNHINGLFQIKPKFLFMIEGQIMDRHFKL